MEKNHRLTRPFPPTEDHSTAKAERKDAPTNKPSAYPNNALLHSVRQLEPFQVQKLQQTLSRKRTEVEWEQPVDFQWQQASPANRQTKPTPNGIESRLEEPYLTLPHQPNLQETGDYEVSPVRMTLPKEADDHKSRGTARRTILISVALVLLLVVIVLCGLLDSTPTRVAFSTKAADDLASSRSVDSVLRYSAEPAIGVAPQTILFTVETALDVASVRLLRDDGTVMNMKGSSVSDHDRIIWSFEAVFAEAFQGETLAFTRSRNGAWVESTQTCRLNITER
ncbi:MAG: hypothetical protein PHI98_01175 [Eubacteriales bacterium]|nr:hypothetical protein [Eubacteriales bacterium]